MNTQSPAETRPFLALFAETRRSYVANAFLNAARRGISDPGDVVTDTLRQARHNASFRPDEPDCRYRQIADMIGQYPAEAQQEAEHAAWWVSLSPDEQRHEKAKRAAASFDIWAEAQEPTDKQVSLLRSLGHGERPVSKAAASRKIDELLKRQRQTPQTALGRAVMDRAGLGGQS